MKIRIVRNWHLFFMVLVLCIPTIQGSLLSVEAISPFSASLCGIYPHNVTISAQKVQNAGNQTIENVTAILVSEPNNGGISIIGPSLYLGSITPGILSVDPSWQVQCADPPGVYTLYVNFSNAQGSLGSSQEETVSVITVYANDQTPPNILSHFPLGVIPTSYMTMEVVTDEDATCKYSSIPGVGYANQQYSFQITGGKSHKVPLQNLIDNFYTYYVRCKDLAGNEAWSDYVVSVEINAPPTATISLSRLSPLSVGTTEVAITTSEPVKPVPSLSYSCNGNTVSVPVTGSGTSWKGYIIISQVNLNEVCSFSFSSTDLSGNAGSYITNGNVFLIDTIPPSAPTAFTAVEHRGLSVKLNWKLPLEGVKNFNIYRLTEESRDFYYYGTTTQNSFTDTVVSIGKTYAYRVSAVDEAGNEGPFSEEVSLLIKGISLEAAAVSAENSGKPTVKAALTLSEIDKTIAEADTLLEEFNALRTRFKTGDNPTDSVFSLLEPSELLKEAKVSLLKKKEGLGLLKNGNLADENIIEEFQAIKDEIDQVRHTVIVDIKTETEKSVVVKAPEEEQISQVISSYLATKKPAMSEEEKDRYLSSVRKMQSAAEVTAALQNIEITYLDGTKEKVVLIRKQVRIKEDGAKDPSSDSSSVKLSLLEFIPKDMASSVEEMILEKDAEIIDPDPLLGYPAPETGTFTYSYVLRKPVDTEAAAKAATLLVPKITPSSTTSGSSDAIKTDAKSWNFLTGNAVVSLADTISFYDVGITIGIILIIIIFIYSLIYSEKEISLKIQHDFPSFDRIRSYLPKRNRKESKNAGRMFPYYAHDDYQEAGLTPLLDSTLSVLLKKTDDALHDLDFEKAVKFYHLFCIQHDSASSKKEKANPSSERIKKKMTLLTKHTLLQYAVERNEFLNVRQVLNEIADLYNELLPGASEKEMRLLEHTRSSHAAYSAMLMKRK
ncbi:MAG: hypothetical protein Q8R47_02805 [Nanoarchaeota archaeon]|nr:hypothetical protein [Nanoarchaeota archaeon]